MVKVVGGEGGDVDLGVIVVFTMMTVVVDMGVIVVLTMMNVGGERGCG